MKLDAISSYKRDSNITKLFLFVAILVVIGSNAYLLHYFQQKDSKYIVVDRDNNALFATHRQLTDEEIIAKMEDHVRDFYNLFFEYGYELEGPNSWKYRTDKALKLIDDSGMELYNKYTNNGVYQKVVEEKWKVTSTVKSFEWDFTNGIQGRVDAVQELTFPNGTTKTRNINATFMMDLDVGIEKDNPHGYKILNFNIFNSSSDG